MSGRITLATVLLALTAGCRSTQGPVAPDLRPETQTLRMGPQMPPPIDANGDGILCGQEKIVEGGAVALRIAVDNELPDGGCPQGFLQMDSLSARS